MNTTIHMADTMMHIIQNMVNTMKIMNIIMKDTMKIMIVIMMNTMIIKKFIMKGTMMIKKVIMIDTMTTQLITHIHHPMNNMRIIKIIRLTGEAMAGGLQFEGNHSVHHTH